MDPRARQVQQNIPEKQSKSSELMYLLTAFGAIALIIFLIFFVVKTIFAGSSDDPSKIEPVTAAAEGSIELIDADDGSNCDNFETQTADLFNSVSVDRKWYLIGEEFTEDQKQINGTVVLNKSIEEASKDIKRFEIKLAIVGETTSPAISAATDDAKKFSGKLAYGTVKPGVQKVVAVADTSCGKVTSVGRDINVSYPIYVVWTLDWEGKGVPQANLDSITNMSAQYGAPLTHFFHPRFLTGSFSASEQQRYLNWLKNRRDNFGEPIELHFHMFYDFVQGAGVTPRTEPAWGWNNSASERGYDVIVSGYSYEDMEKLLTYSKKIFTDNGLEAPTMFRAGGWQADTETLQVLADNGFVLDSSGRDRFTLGSNNIPVPWLLSSSTQPYKPAVYSQNEVNADKEDQMSIWEFPNNGLDSTANNGAFLYQRFLDNYEGKPLTERRTVNYLSHPDYFTYDKTPMTTLFNSLGNHAYNADKGPMVYQDLEYVYGVWGLK